MIANRTKTLREARGITQAELARSLFLTRAGVNNWEQGLSTPSPASIVDLAHFFNVSTDYLLGLDSGVSIRADGLSNRDVALLAELANRLREHSDAP